MPLLQIDDDQTTAPPATWSLDNPNRVLVLGGDVSRVLVLGADARVTPLERAGRSAPLGNTGVLG